MSTHSGRAAHAHPSAASTWVQAALLGILLCVSTAAHAQTPLERRAAAEQTANSHPDCVVVQPFYWEIGDRDHRLVSGSVGSEAPTRHTPLLIASATKWLFGAYVVEARNGEPTAADIEALTMRSGYTSMSYARSLSDLS